MHFEALSRALGTLGYSRLYDLDDIANGGPEHAEFWLRAVRHKLSGQKAFSKSEIDTLLQGYDVSPYENDNWPREGTSF